MTLYVGNISHIVNNAALSALFETFGEVKSVKILTDNQTGQSKGIGFVDMPDEHHALNAMNKLTNAVFFGRKLFVSKARPKS